MKGICLTFLLAPLMVAAGASPAAQPASQPATVELGPRYTDVLRGFSLRPLTGTERLRRTASRRLVLWVRRDKKTAAIRWSLDVLQARQKPSELPLADYAKAMAAELARSNNFHVESTQIATIAGKPAMHFRGIWRGTLHLWRRQCWVQLAPGEFLVVNLAGPVTDKDALDASMTAVLKSLRLFDPKAAREERRKNLLRGAELLKQFNDDALLALPGNQIHYFRVSLKGKPIGFFRIAESLTQRDNVIGLQVVRGGFMEIKGAPRQLTREDLFATADRKSEQWQRLDETAGGVIVNDGLKQNDLLVMQTTVPPKPRETRQKEVPKSIRDGYLPQALAAVLPRLIDRSKAGAYAFAVYNPASNDFDMRTISVVGPEEITLAGSKRRSVRLTDQTAFDAEPVDLWVDERGGVLRMASPGGLAMERVDRQTIIRQYAAELLELDKLKDALKDPNKYRLPRGD